MARLPKDASPTDQNANTNTRAEEQELNQTVNEKGERITNATGSNTDDEGNRTDATGAPVPSTTNVEGRDGGAPAPGTDNSTAETLKVRTTGNFLVHDPFTGVTIDNSDNGGNEDGVIKSSIIATALEDGRLTEDGWKSVSEDKGE